MKHAEPILTTALGTGVASAIEKIRWDSSPDEDFAPSPVRCYSQFLRIQECHNVLAFPWDTVRSHVASSCEERYHRSADDESVSACDVGRIDHVL
ncbi:MAG: hypothetical protein AAFX06_03475 [Planctomycetota bacterium]